MAETSFIGFLYVFYIVFFVENLYFGGKLGPQTYYSQY